MARSAEHPRWRGAGAAAVVLAALTSAGCSTTQDEAARLQLNSARIRAGELPTVVRAPGGRVRVGSVAVIGSPRAGSAVVVEVRNPSRQAVADLPVAVGERLPGRRRRPLNERSTRELSYFDSHLPLIAGDGRLTWVYMTPRHLTRSVAPYAWVGGTSAPAIGRRGTAAPPRIDVRVLATPRSGARLTVVLRNTTSVPQYQLPVYLVGDRAGHPVAAGTTVVAHLGSHATEHVSVTVVGPLRGLALRAVAVPTILR